MPRCARVKSFDSIYHVMVRSVGKISLYENDDDKNVYLNLIKKYKEIFFFKVYAFCLMDTHAHFIIDSNGADVSRFMHVINQCYAQYFNKKYKRTGHVFGDRFKSCIVNDDRYLLVLSGYIHNNPTDIKEFMNSIEFYPYSSLGVYLGIAQDPHKILDTSFILKQLSNNIKTARIIYNKFVGTCVDIDLKNDMEFENELSEYRSERRILLRNYTFEQITSFISKYTTDSDSSIHLKFIQKTKDFKSICIVLMRSLCNLSYKEICAQAGNITISHASKLSSEGFKILNNNPKYKLIVKELINLNRIKIS
jgi:putative transposase